ncbi:MAG: hypothetical protein JNL11_10535 [Bdellovibrionaceae bacterium]|nr:hypothetical protein [Pseudobdellovibrionaceae bacterium]
MIKKTKFVFFLLGLFVSNGNGAELLPWQYDCGYYNISGRLTQTKNFTILRVNPDTRFEHELILLGGNFGRRLLFTDELVFTKIYVPKAIQNQKRPIVFMQSLSLNVNNSSNQNKELVKKIECGRFDLFKTNL